MDSDLNPYLGFFELDLDSEVVAKNPLHSNHDSSQLDLDSRKKGVDSDLAGFGFEMDGFAHHWLELYITDKIQNGVKYDILSGCKNFAKV